MAANEVEVSAVAELLGVRWFVTDQLKSGNAAPFLIDRDDRFHLTEITKIVDELAELRGGLNVASEENEAARLDLAEEAGGFGIEFGAGDADEQRYLQMVAEMLFSLLDRWQSAEALEQTQAELERLSLSDPLTGLGNRRHFEQVREQECRRAVRHGQPLSVLMLDVDYFKAYNDQYGHGAGDDCLVRIADCIRHLFQRAGELPVRLGGEEFAVILPAYDSDLAQAAAERVRSAVLALQCPHAGAPLGQLSVSLGVAAWTPADEQPLDFEALLERADRALYQAKAGGRNRVCVSPLR